MGDWFGFFVDYSGFHTGSVLKHFHRLFLRVSDFLHGFSGNAVSGPQYSLLHLMKNTIAIKAERSSVAACASQRPSVPRSRGRTRIITV
jgi:hypothetical protein